MIDRLGQSDYFRWSIVKSQPIPITSIAKAMFRNQNYNTGQLRYFDNNLSRTSKLNLNGFLSLLSTSTTVLKQNN